MAIERSRRGMLASVISVVLLLPLGGPPVAAYDAIDAVNHTAFDSACIGWDDPFPHKMVAAAAAAYGRLGYGVGQLFGAPFSKAAVLNRTATDWGTYIHSHGDFYYNADGYRYSGFREDAGRCTGAAIVYSKEILARRAARQSNLVIMSTCHLGETNTTMPGAYAIEKVQVHWNGPEFYLGYVGSAYDNDEWTFEQALWSGLARGNNLGVAFDVASAGSFTHPFDANWWGSYAYTGKAGPYTGCRTCV
ncbi:MAG: hypothetical protein ACXWMU_01465 [Candidatus Limnocylindrales bacterium]